MKATVDSANKPMVYLSVEVSVDSPIPLQARMTACQSPLCPLLLKQPTAKGAATAEAASARYTVMHVHTTALLQSQCCSQWVI